MPKKYYTDLAMYSTCRITSGSNGPERVASVELQLVLNTALCG